MRLKARTLRLVLALSALPFAASAVRATDINLASWITAVKVSGDYRLRQENFSNQTEGNGQVGRSRQRFRLRVGLELPLPSYVTTKLRFATSGGQEQFSTNQSFDNLSNEKAFWIDRAYMEWKPIGGTDKLKLAGGRMANPLWNQYSSDAVWDDDFNPEGFAEGTEFLAGPVKLFGNALQMVVDEDGGNTGDQWELSTQIGAELRLPFESRLRVAVAQHQWVNETTTTHRLAAGNFGQANPAGFNNASIQNGNRRYGAAGALANEFRVNEITALLAFWVKSIPVSLQATFIKNVDALDPAAMSASLFAGQKKADTGSQIGAIVGKASAAKSWEAAYFMKKLETDATVADVADSDFGNGGTGRKGSIMWVAYNPQEWLQFKVKYFMTKLEDPNLPPGPASAAVKDFDLNRLQADVSVKF